MRDLLSGLLSLCLVFLLVLGTGCTSAAIGDVSYRNCTLTVPVSSTADPVDAFMQVTVYEIRDFNQQELTTVQQPVHLTFGENTLQIPLSLEPGTYKLYIYILNPGERQTAAIRDIVV